MAVTITGEQIYLNGSTLTTPQVNGSVKFCYAGYNSSTKQRHVTLYTCKTDKPLSQITFTIRNAGTDSTGANKYLGIFVTPSKISEYLTSSAGGDTKLRFDYTCTNDGTPVNGTSGAATGIVTKSIPAGTFYIYVVPYSGTSTTTTSTFYSNSSSTSKPTISGAEVTGCVYIDNGSKFEAYQCYVDNGSGWDLCLPYVDNGSGWDLCG